MTALATFPSVVFPVENVESVVGVWWVAYCKSRQEKVFAADLESAGIPAYLPLTTYRNSKAGRTWITHEPTFPGYCFFAAKGTRGDDSYAKDLYAVKANSRVVTLLDIKDQYLFVKELGQIQRALTIDPTLGSCMMLTPGKRVRVVKGDFMGLEGVLERHTKSTFHVVLSYMQTSVPIEFENASYLEPI